MVEDISGFAVASSEMVVSVAVVDKGAAYVDENNHSSHLLPF